MARRKCSSSGRDAESSAPPLLEEDLPAFLSFVLSFTLSFTLSFISWAEGLLDASFAAYVDMASSQKRTNRLARLRRAPWRAVRLTVCRMRLRADGLFAMIPVTFVRCPR